MRRNASRTISSFSASCRGSGDVREVTPATGRVVAGRLAVGRRVEDVDGGGKQHASALAVEPRADALAGNRAGHQDDLPVQPRQHPAAGRGLVDQELDEIAWTRHLYSPASAGSCARSRSSRACAAARAWRHASAGMRSRNGRRSSSACDVELGQHGLAGGGAGGVDQAGIERRQVGQDPLARLAACALGARPQPIERAHDFVEHVVGQPQRRRPRRRRRPAKRGQPADRAGDVRRQSFTPPSRGLLAR